MQVKFRGKTESGEWVYGNYVTFENEKHGVDAEVFAPDYIHMIVTFQDADYDVDPESIGMFTGFHDKNGNEIYGAIGEKGGDIVEKNDSKFCKRGVVKMPEGTWMVVEDETHYFNLHFYQNQIQLIGSEIDNPELLEQ